MKICRICKLPKNDDDFYVYSYGTPMTACKYCELLRREKVRIKKLTMEKKIEFILTRYWTKTRSIEDIAYIFDTTFEEVKNYLIIVGIFNHKYKPCGKCKKIRPIEDFSEAQLNWSGWCIDCKRELDSEIYYKNSDYRKEQASNYYYDNIEKAKENNKSYREKNKEILKLKAKEYVNNNRDSILEKHRIYYQNNRDRILSYVSEYNKIYRGEANARNSKYRSSRLQSCPKWADRKKIKEIYKEAKRITKETGIIHVVDHIIPLRGRLVSGLHVHENLQIIPFVDNCIKSNKFKPIIESF